MTDLNNLINQIDKAAVTPAVQPLVDSMKDLAKAVKDLADKDEDMDEDMDEDTSDPDTDDDIKDRLDKHEKRLDDMMKDNDEDMEKGVLALDVTDYLDRLVKSVQGLPEIVAKLSADNAELRKAIIASTEHTAALTKAVMSIGSTRHAVETVDSSVIASGERFNPAVVLTQKLPGDKLAKAVRASVITGAQFDRYSTSGRLVVDDTENANLIKQISTL